MEAGYSKNSKIKNQTLTKTQPVKNEMNKTDWKKSSFYLRMLALQACSLTYQQSAEAYRDSWNKLSPELQNLLRAIGGKDEKDK
jgi:hypothetical protein